ncbi:hypothetical protein Tco_0878295 [Tanacetum coccineum]|uniref:Uncharacterized protein n=1 Tax=Tanacetum coccineum TaxID=301880 RepID=A0ABQ5C2U8_9ASTR
MSCYGHLENHALWNIAIIYESLMAAADEKQQWLVLWATYEDGDRSGRTSSIPEVLDESIVVFSTSSEGTEESEYNEEDDVDENIDWVDTDEMEEKNDDDDDKSIDLEKIDDEETDDEFVQSEEHDEEMTNAEDADTGNGDEQITDTAKADAEKIEEVKDDIIKAEFPPSSSSLSVSSCFSNQFLNLSYDKSIVENLKDTADAEINSLMKQSIDLEKEPTRSTSEILKVKKEQEDKQKMTKYTIKSTNKKRPNDNEDEDPSTGPNQGKKTKRRRTKESESSKKTSTTKETSRGKVPTKGSKAVKSATTEESVKEPITDVVMDYAVNPGAKYVVRDDDQPQDTLEPKTEKTPKHNWFTQPPRPPTPDPE